MQANTLSILAVSVSLIFGSHACGQQGADTTFMPPLISKYVHKPGVTIMIDEAHHNFHTATTGYRPFAKLLTRHGHQVEAGIQPFSGAGLKDVGILVIANALNGLNTRNWALPTPSAFSPTEINAVKEWVSEGGALLLIADHMPFAGAARDLAGSFGFVFYNGFAFDSTDREKFGDVFRRSDGTLGPVDKLQTEDIDSVASFTGQAFDIPSGAISLLNLADHYIILLPQQAWVFDENTPKLSASGKSQGALMQYGKGRIAVFGEAAMFTAQIAGDTKVGMNSKEGSMNSVLLLAIVKWLNDEP